MRLVLIVVQLSSLALTACAPQPYSISSYSSSSYPNLLENLQNNTKYEAHQEAEAARAAIASKTLAPFTVAAAENAIREGLRDPESARFREVKRNTSTGAVCGYLNAKNAYGGYVGEAPFIYYHSDKYKAPQALSGEDVAKTATLPYIAAFCPTDNTTVNGDGPVSEPRRIRGRRN